MKNRRKPKKKSAVCKNCLLYNFQERHCRVVVLYEGERIHPPTEPEDHCIFDDMYQSITPDGKIETWKPEVSQVKWWVENPTTGEKSDKGVVKIEYPADFFGKEDPETNPLN